MSDTLKIKRQQLIIQALQHPDQVTGAGMDEDLLTFNKIKEWVSLELGTQFNDQTIRRDIKELIGLGANIDKERYGRQVEYVLEDNFEHPNAISEKDILGLAILSEAITNYSGAYIEKQLKNLSDKISNRTKMKGGYTAEEIKNAITFRPPPTQSVDSETWGTILEAILKKAQITCDYPPQEKITLEPYHLVSSEGEWYLLAGTDEAPVTQYSLARMSNVVRVPGHNLFNHPEDFDAKELLESSFRSFISAGEVKTVCVRVSGLMVDYVRNRTFQPRQKVKELDDGSLEISFLAGEKGSGPVPYGNVVSWVLRMGQYAKVIEPREVIDRVKEEAQKLLKQYE